MRPRVFLDTNVFIYAFEFSSSNSSTLLEFLNRNKIVGVISEQVLKEVMNYFKKYYTKDLASLFRFYLLESCILVFGEEVSDRIRALKGVIKDKDLEQLAVVREKGIKYLVSYDEDFKPFKEYCTPKEFVQELGLEPSKSNF